MPIQRKTVIAITLMWVVSMGANVAFAESTVSYENGFLTLNCRQAPLEEVFQKIRAATGLELIVEDAAKSITFTASVRSRNQDAVIKKLLEGSGLIYALVMDPRDSDKVAKLYIGVGTAESAAHIVVASPEREQVPSLIPGSSPAAAAAPTPTSTSSDDVSSESPDDPVEPGSPLPASVLRQDGGGELPPLGGATEHGRPEVTKETAQTPTLDEGPAERPDDMPEEEGASGPGDFTPVSGETPGLTPAPPKKPKKQ